MPSVGSVLFHCSLKIKLTHSFFFETLVDKIKNWYYKVRGIYCKMRQKAVTKIFLQTVTEVYYKVRQVL